MHTATLSALKILDDESPIVPGSARFLAKSKAAARILIDLLLPFLAREGRTPADAASMVSDLSGLALLMGDGAIRMRHAKEMLPLLLGGEPLAVALVRTGMLAEDADLDALASRVAEMEPKAAADYAAGKDSAAGRLVGQAMKETGGRLDPAAFAETLKTILRRKP